MRRIAAPPGSAWSALKAARLELRGVGQLDVPDEPEPLQAVVCQPSPKRSSATTRLFRDSSRER
jgi:hypothetical protein